MYIFYKLIDIILFSPFAFSRFCMKNDGQFLPILILGCSLCHLLIGARICTYINDLKAHIWHASLQGAFPCIRVPNAEPKVKEALSRCDCAWWEAQRGAAHLHSPRVCFSPNSLDLGRYEPYLTREMREQPDDVDTGEIWEMLEGDGVSEKQRRIGLVKRSVSFMGWYFNKFSLMVPAHILTWPNFYLFQPYVLYQCIWPKYIYILL